MNEELRKAFLVIDRELLGQNLYGERAQSLADEVYHLNAGVRAFSFEQLDFYDDPSSFLAMLRQTAWTPPSPDER